MSNGMMDTSATSFWNDQRCRQHGWWLLLVLAVILYLPGTATIPLMDRVEPRFAHGVHMMKRAIRAMDLHRVHALVVAGCPWVSHDDVRDALPLDIEYDEAMEILGVCGLRVTFRY